MFQCGDPNVTELDATRPDSVPRKGGINSSDSLLLGTQFRYRAKL